MSGDTLQEIRKLPSGNYNIQFRLLYVSANHCNLHLSCITNCGDKEELYIVGYTKARIPSC